MEISAKCGICESTFYVAEVGEYRATSLYNEWKDYHNEKCITPANEVEGGEQTEDSN